MNAPRIHVMRNTNNHRLTTFRHQGKSFVLGFPVKYHRDIVSDRSKKTCNGEEIAVRVFPNMPTDITEQIRDLVCAVRTHTHTYGGATLDMNKSDNRLITTLPMRSVMMDTGCLFEFHKKTPRRNPDHPIVIISKYPKHKKDSDEKNHISTDTFISLCVGGVLGIALPLELERETSRNIVFSGQMIYGTEPDPEFFLDTLSQSSS